MKGQDVQKLPSYQGDSPASRFHAQGLGRDLQIHATSGRRCAGSSTSFAPVSCLARMLLTSPIWGCRGRSLTWSSRDMQSGHSLYLLVPSAHGTNGSGRSSSELMFPTPLATDMGGKRTTQGICRMPTGSLRRARKKGGYWSALLSEAVYFLDPEADPSYRLNPEWVEWLMGFPQGWTDASSGT